MMKNVIFGLVELYFSSCSVGVRIVIYKIQAPPCNGDNDYEILKAVKRGIYRFEDDEWSNISPEAKKFIAKMLNLGRFLGS